MDEEGFQLTWKELNEKFGGIDREDMTEEQLKEYLSICFDLYEADGFTKLFTSPYDLEEENLYKGKPYTVIQRLNDTYIDPCFLPMWMIKFEDGNMMAVYPEEVIVTQVELPQ